MSIVTSTYSGIHRQHVHMEYKQKFAFDLCIRISDQM